MPAFRFLNVVILSVLIACSALVYAQDEKPQENKPPQQEEPKAQPKPHETGHQDEAKPQQDEAKPSKEDKQEQKQEQKDSRDQRRPEGQEHPAQPMGHAQPQAQGHPEQQAGNGGPAGKGGHIPDDKFRAHFGRTHTFTAKTVIVQGQPQFQYSGYSFRLVDAWPVGWAYTDECYIDYINGEYFLFDLLHPGVQIAVFVVM